MLSEQVHECVCPGSEVIVPLHTNCAPLFRAVHCAIANMLAVCRHWLFEPYERPLALSHALMASAAGGAWASCCPCAAKRPCSTSKAPARERQLSKEEPWNNVAFQADDGNSSLCGNVLNLAGED